MPASLPLVTPPATYNELKDVIVSHASTLPKRLRQCATYVVSEPDEVALGIIADIARKAGVHASTLVRFAQVFGYSGFTSMQHVFRTRMTNRWPDYGDRLRVLEDQQKIHVLELLNGFADTASHSIERLREECDPAALERAVATLAGAETIYILGLRRSFAVSAYLAYAFSKLNVRSVLLGQAGGLLADQATFVAPKDALLVITFMPYTPEVIEVTSVVKANNVPVMAISDNPLSPIAHLADTLLEVHEADLGSFRSLSATMCLAMTLAVAVGEARNRPLKA